MSSVTGGRKGVPPPTTTGLRNGRSSSTRPSPIAAAARPAPPIATSLSVDVERRGGLLSQRRHGEPGVALDAVKRAAEDDLRDGTPDVGERGLELAVAHRRIRLPRQHGLVQPAAAQKAAELARLREVETKLLLARDRPREPAPAVGDEAVHRHAHRVDQHGFQLIAPQRRTTTPMKVTAERDIGLFLPLQGAHSSMNCSAAGATKGRRRPRRGAPGTTAGGLDRRATQWPSV